MSTKSKVDYDEIIKNIEELWEQFKEVIRPRFPYIPEEAIDRRAIVTGDFYLNSVRITTSRAISHDQREKWNEAAHSLNQYFIIRLYALLDSSGDDNFRSKLFSGNTKIKILTKMRNVFAHTPGKYKPEKNEHKELFEKIEKLFKVDGSEAKKRGEFCIPIDKILKEIKETSIECIECIRNDESKHVMPFKTKYFCEAANYIIENINDISKSDQKTIKKKCDKLMRVIEQNMLES